MMEQALAAQYAESGQNPLDQSGLCLLSLDGGGVRGLSTLYILKALMTKLNQERQDANLAVVKPCELFDLIGGTSTGGLIAIMLGRLEMDVDECITAYTELMKPVFEARLRRLPLDWRLQTRAQFDSAKLESAVKKVIKGRGISETELFNDKVARGCKVFVCTTAKETTWTTRLRSYSLPGGVDTRATICEAVLATSAATGFFNPVRIGARKYEDGGLGANNPADEVEDEARNIWCSETGYLEPLVKCFLSIGTGHPGKKEIQDNMLKFLSETLVAITVETEKTAEKSIARWRQHFREKRYFRFNVHQGLQDVGLAEYKEQGTIEAATEEYLGHQEQKFQVQDCVHNLRQKKNRTEYKFAAIINEHNRLVSSRTGATKALYFLPLKRNRRFVGRSSQLDELEVELFGEGTPQKVAVEGLGGVGKTQIVLELAYRTKRNRPNCSIFWVTANSVESFEQAYLEIGRLLEIPGVADEKSDVKMLVKNYLSQDRAGEWLMIVDNADDFDLWFKKTDNTSQPTALIDHIPGSNKGSIICTTRDRKVAVDMAQSNVMKVSEMDEATAIQVLRKYLIHPEITKDSESVSKLLNQLTCLPLAIVQAAAYINKNEITIPDYLSLFEEAEEDIVAVLSEDFEDDGRYRHSKNPVATTWLISFEQIQRRDPLAAEYLSFMSCVDPNNIPQSLLPAQPKKRVIEAIGTLSAYSIITKRSADRPTDDQVFDLHRLVHLATRNWLRNKGSLPMWTGNTIERLVELFPNVDHENKALWTAYLPHTRHVVGPSLSDESTNDSVELFDKIGWCLLLNGKYNEAEGICLQVARWRESVLGEEHLDTLVSLRECADVLSLNGKYQEAESLSRRALKGFEKTLGRETTETAICLQVLARAIFDQGRWTEAEELQVEVVDINKRIHGDEHRETLSSMNSLALTLYSLGRWTEAEKLQSQVLEMRRRIHGDEHPDTVTVMSNVALTLWKQGQLVEAQKLQEKVLEMRKRILGPEHPDTLIAMSNLASTQRKQGQLIEAQKLQEEVLEMKKRILGPEHPDTLIAISNLALTLQKQGQLVEAQKLGEEVLEMRKRILGQEHPGILIAISNLASILWKQGRLIEAQEIEEEVLEMRKRVFGQEHPNTLASMGNLPVYWHSQGRLNEALVLMKQAERLTEGVLGSEHPNTTAMRDKLEEWREEIQSAVKRTKGTDRFRNHGFCERGEGAEEEGTEEGAEEEGTEEGGTEEEGTEEEGKEDGRRKVAHDVYGTCATGYDASDPIEGELIASWTIV